MSDWAGLAGPEAVKISSRKMRICSGRGFSTWSPSGEVPKVICSAPITPRLMFSSGICWASQASWMASFRFMLVWMPAADFYKWTGAAINPQRIGFMILRMPRSPSLPLGPVSRRPVLRRGRTPAPVRAAPEDRVSGGYCLDRSTLILSTST
jgi:hypothetical protein